MSDACHQDFNGGLGSDKGKGVLISGWHFGLTWAERQEWLV
jgi:hypothetical protein